MTMDEIKDLNMLDLSSSSVWKLALVAYARLVKPPADEGELLSDEETKRLSTLVMSLTNSAGNLWIAEQELARRSQPQGLGQMDTIGLKNRPHGGGGYN